MVIVEWKGVFYMAGIVIQVHGVVDTECYSAELLTIKNGGKSCKNPIRRPNPNLMVNQLNLLVST